MRAYPSRNHAPPGRVISALSSLSSGWFCLSTWVGILLYFQNYTLIPRLAYAVW